MTTNGYGGSFQSEENIQELDSSYCHSTTLWIYWKPLNFRSCKDELYDMWTLSQQAIKKQNKTKTYIGSYRLSLPTNAHTQYCKRSCQERGDVRKRGAVYGDAAHGPLRSPVTGTLIHSKWKKKLATPLWRTTWQYLSKCKDYVPSDSLISVLGISPTDTLARKQN